MSNRRKFLQYAGAALLAGPTVGLAAATRVQQLPLRPIPGTDEVLPVIGLGNSNAFRNGDKTASSQLIDRFRKFGGQYIDCGGVSRFVVAEAAQNLGAGRDIFLGTYFNLEDESAALIEARTLTELTGKKTLDLLQAYPEHAIPYWDNFRRWKDDGKARFIGVARHNQRYYEAMMKLMETRSVDFLQVNYSLMEPEAENRILPMAADLGVAVTINRPFINGSYFDVVRGHELPEWAAEFDCNSWAQFSLKFILSHPAVTCVLTETANPKHAEDNLGAGFGRLPDPPTRDRMRALMGKLSP